MKWSARKFRGELSVEQLDTYAVLMFTELAMSDDNGDDRSSLERGARYV